MSTEPGKKQLNVNTVLLTIILAVLGYVGKTTMDSKDAVTEVRTELRARTTSGERMERKLDDLGTQVNGQRDIITELRVDLANLKRNLVTTKPQ